MTILTQKHQSITKISTTTVLKDNIIYRENKCFWLLRVTVLYSAKYTFVKRSAVIFYNIWQLKMMLSNFNIVLWQLYSWKFSLLNYKVLVSKHGYISKQYIREYTYACWSYISWYFKFCCIQERIWLIKTTLMINLYHCSY